MSKSYLVIPSLLIVKVHHLQTGFTTSYTRGRRCLLSFFFFSTTFCFYLFFCFALFSLLTHSLVLKMLRQGSSFFFFFDDLGDFYTPSVLPKASKRSLSLRLTGYSLAPKILWEKNDLFYVGVFICGNFLEPT